MSEYPDLDRVIEAVEYSNKSRQKRFAKIAEQLRKLADEIDKEWGERPSKRSPDPA